MSLRYVLFSGLVILSHSLFSYDSLTFRSSFEARLLKAAMTSKDIDLLSLYASASVDSVESAKYSVRLDDFFAKVDQKVRSAKTDKLRAKLLFKEAHEFFLKKYEEKITLDRIFKDGYYNCVTGSMLYAIIY